MSGKPKKPDETPPDFRKGDPDGEGLRRAVEHTIKTMTQNQLVEMGNTIHRGAQAQTNLDRAGKKLWRTQYIADLAMRPENRHRSAAWLYDHLSDADKVAIGKPSSSAFRK